MRRIARLSPLSVVAFAFALALPQFAFAQRLRPIPHPIGIMQHPNGEAQATAQAEASPEARAEAKSATSSKTPASPWTPLTNQPNFLINGASNPILLTDGSILVRKHRFPRLVETDAGQIRQLREWHLDPGGLFARHL